MAMQFQGSEGAKRSDIYSVDPTTIIMDESKNGRMFPVSDADIDNLAANIKAVLQQHPVTCRRLSNKQLQLVSGYTRLKAILRLHVQDPKWRIRIQIVELNESDAFLANISENLKRNEVSPIDHAYNARRLESAFGFTREQTAEFFGWAPAKVARHLTLLTLPEKVQRQVASRELTVDAAIKLSKLDESEIDDALEAAVSDDGHINGTEVARQVRERGVRVGHTVSELRKVLRDRNEPIAIAILGYLKGDVDEVGLEEALDGSHPYQEV
jgi:ParB/RepB/Spo0J family partition protein